MRARVNLLPESYRKARRNRRRYRIGVGIGVALLSAELLAGVVLHARAGQTRRLQEAAQTARQEARSLNAQLAEPAREAAMISQQIAMASRLRAKHHWSRLLARLAAMAPDRVVLTQVSTDPPQWTREQYTAAQKPIEEAAQTKNAKKVEVRPLIGGVMLKGFAMDYGDLAQFNAEVHSARLFSHIDLKQARRDTFMNQDAVSFELQCNW